MQQQYQTTEQPTTYTPPAPVAAQAETQIDAIQSVTRKRPKRAHQDETNIDIMLKTARFTRSLKGQLGWLCTVYVFLSGWLYYSFSTTVGHWQGPSAAYYSRLMRVYEIGFIGAIAAMAVAVILLYVARQLSNIHKIVAQHDIQLVGALIDGWNFGTPKLRARVRVSLLNILPQLQSENAGLLDAKHRTQLIQAANSGNTELSLAILHAWKQVGGAQELSAAERMLRRTNLDVQVREAAEACLPTLKARAAQTQSSDTLLRASEPQTVPDTLLRAASSTAGTPDGQLLRAAEPLP